MINYICDIISCVLPVCPQTIRLSQSDKHEAPGEGRQADVTQVQLRSCGLIVIAKQFPLYKQYNMLNNSVVLKHMLFKVSDKVKGNSHREPDHIIELICMHLL